MNDWLPTSVANWAGALVAAAGWALSNWTMMIAAVALMGLAAVVFRSTRHVARNSHNWPGFSRHDSPTPNSQ